MPDPEPMISERWHMDLAYAKGWESEPDESRRTKSRFARYYTRDFSSRSDGHSNIRRSRSVRETSHKSPSPTQWHDLLPKTVDDEELWDGMTLLDDFT